MTDPIKLRRSFFYVPGSYPQLLEGAAKVAAAGIVARIKGGTEPAPFTGAGACYIECGAGRIGRVDVDFLSGPSPTGSFSSDGPKYTSSIGGGNTVVTGTPWTPPP